MHEKYFKTTDASLTYTLKEIGIFYSITIEALNP
jgi:hypothetical protein